jgi:SAM-dependent methyltransferase
MATIHNSLQLLIVNPPTLLKLLDTFVNNSPLALQKIQKSLSLKRQESEIYKEILTPELTTKNDSWLQRRAINRADLRFQILKQLNITVKTYIDYGAGEADITQETQRLLEQKGATGINGYAVDIAEWHGHVNLKNLKQSKIAMVTLDPDLLKYPTLYDLLPFIADHSVDVIFIEMVLHHLSLPLRTRLYRTLHRILNPQGVIIIREHGPSTPAEEAYIHVQHGLYGALEKDDFFHTYYAEYQSQTQWLAEWTSWDFVQRPLKGKISWLNRLFGDASILYTILGKNSLELTLPNGLVTAAYPSYTQTFISHKDEIPSYVRLIKSPREIVDESLEGYIAIVSPVPISLTSYLDLHNWSERRLGVHTWSYSLDRNTLISSPVD